MTHKLFYYIIGYMWDWGYKLTYTTHPCVLMENIEAMVVLHGEDSKEFITHNMERVVGDSVWGIDDDATFLTTLFVPVGK